ncbi:ArsR/SmtB family transcription factor [Gordonia phosphorivorans]|uniref:ArsR/SmtB family transcription factor n=1 Tax=Gordonia phosphorivorans TaxID=1056982 RepID=A0ABV6HCX0_9ACTN
MTQIDVVSEPPSTADRTAAGELLRALSAPARISIVLALNERAMCVHELVDELHLNQPQVSQHLRVLKNSGVVAGSRRGREVEYTLVDDHITHIVTDALIHVTEGHSEESA